MSQHASARATNAGRTFTIIGAVLGALAILILPIILGPAGAILGFVGYSKGDKPLGLYVGIGSIITTIVGIALGAAIMSGMN